MTKQMAKRRTWLSDDKPAGRFANMIHNLMDPIQAQRLVTLQVIKATHQHKH